MTSLALLASWRETHFGHWGFVSDFRVSRFVLSSVMFHAFLPICPVYCGARLRIMAQEVWLWNRLIYAACGAGWPGGCGTGAEWQAEE